MTTEIAVRQNGDVPMVSWTTEQVDLIKRTIAVGSTNDELQLFLYQAKRTGLDPLSRQIHFVKRKDKGTIQTAIDGYRLIADRTGKYAGNDDYLFDAGLTQYQHMAQDSGNPWTATATVYKMVDGVRTPFTATAGWTEYFPGEAQGFMWKKMPYLMIGKCAEALALRKAFPAELSGIYTNEEMMQADAETPHSTTRQAPANEAEMCAPNYGKYAKQPLSSIPEEGLIDYLEGMKRSIADPKKANFKAKNQAMLEAIELELERRDSTEVVAMDDGPAVEVSEAQTPQLDAANVCQQFTLSESMAEWSEIANSWQSEVELHTDAERKAVKAAADTAKKRLEKKK